MAGFLRMTRRGDDAQLLHHAHHVPVGPALDDPAVDDYPGVGVIHTQSYDRRVRNRLASTEKTEDTGLHIGLQVPRFTWPDAPDSIGPKLAQIGEAAEEAGFASIWVMDHFFQIGAVGAAEEPMLEGYSALNFIAGVTERAKLGTLVTGVQYRHPGILAKTVTTLDVLSEIGRAHV